MAFSKFYAYMTSSNCYTAAGTFACANDRDTAI